MDLFIVLAVSTFPTYSMLQLNNKKFGPQIRIVRGNSSLEPAPKVWKQNSRSKNPSLCFLVRTYKVGVLGILVVTEVPELSRKLREACRKNFPHISSKSALVTPNYLQSTS